ncbi:unnamed protein product [Caretta caretta]
MVKLHGTETHGNCQLFCLSFCESNLEDHLSKSVQGVNNHDILKTLLEAVRDLHSLELGHGDLHPRNILIDFDKSSSFAEGQRELIIKEDLESIGAMQARSFGGRGLPSARSIGTRKVGPICCNKGSHKKFGLPHGGNTVQLGDLIHHPFFWTHESRFEFLVDVGNNPDIEKRNSESQIVKALSCNKATTEKHFYQIDQDVLKNMEKRRPYEDTVTDLLRLIRNVGAHYGGKPQWA